MKKIVLILLLFIASGCVQVTGTRYLSGTTIGIEAGLPEGLTLVIGYRRFEAVTCETEANIEIGLDGSATATGLEGEQHARFGEAANRESSQDKSGEQSISP